MAKRQKTYEADGPVEDDKTAREKLREAGFDPDDVHTARSDLEAPQEMGMWYNITPMTHFAYYGDLPMCRYLYHVRGAVTTKAADEHRTELDDFVPWYPIFSAAHEYHFDIAKWLYQNGAKSEVLEVVERASALSTGFYKSGMSPSREGAVDFAKWLILEGVLEEGSAAAANDRRLHNFLYELQRGNSQWKLEDIPRVFIGWMDELLNPNALFNNFLLGTVRDPQYSASEMKRLLGRRIRSDAAASMIVDDVISNGRALEVWDRQMADAGRATSFNSCLAPFPGVLEKIGDYVGIIKNKTKLKRVIDAKAIAQNVTIEELLRS